jgi:ATP-dependent Lhr-like helicase
VVLARRETIQHFVRPPSAEDEHLVRARLLDALRSRGAVFFSDLVVAALAPHPEVLEVLWDLVWDGLVTNDTLAPLRALSWPRRSGGSAAPRGRRLGLPPESAGRWSLVPRPPEATRQELTSRAHTRAETLLERLGIVTREGVAAEDLEGGFSSVYPVLKAMEDAGRVRRGYFVEGLGAAQFGLPGAAERVRAEREPPEEPVASALSAVDPAQPYGATLPWPREEEGQRKPFQRVPGARVYLIDGEPVLYLDRSHRGLLTFPAANDEALLAMAITALAEDSVAVGAKGLSIERINGEPAYESHLGHALRNAGFAQGFRGLTLRPPRAQAMAHA